jgi:hypothetical protein
MEVPVAGVLIEPELMVLLPDMELVELPAGVLCAKAGAAIKAAAPIRSAASVVFMVFFPL